MKLCLFSLLTLISSSVFAHGHWPQQIEAKYLLTEVYELKFNLSNHFKQKTCFDIEVNGKIISPLRQCLQPRKNKDISVWVSSGIDKKITNRVCSIAINSKSINTKMCTSATTMYPKSKLRGRQ